MWCIRYILVSGVSFTVGFWQWFNVQHALDHCKTDDTCFLLAKEHFTSDKLHDLAFFCFISGWNVKNINVLQHIVIWYQLCNLSSETFSHFVSYKSMQPFDPFFVYAFKVITLKGTLNKFILSICRQNGLKNNTLERLYLESVNNVWLLTREAR